MVFSRRAIFLKLILSCISFGFSQIAPDEHIDPSLDLESLGNNSLYLRWRPQFHVLPPGGWMNDPCGPMYDETRGLYHIFYQAFPQHVQFGNISWGHATSRDLIYWTDVVDWRNRSVLAIETGPFGTYDWLGVFSGGAQPVNLQGENDGNITLMFTGASRWPDNWLLPYREGTETQNIATSSDGGSTWQKYEGNPVIAEVPPGWNVTGLRDPIFQPMVELDSILGKSEPHYYLIMGSGIHGAGPRLPLYTAKASDLTNWTFEGALFEMDINTTWGGDMSRTGTFGGNFELAGFFPLLEKEENGGDGNTKHFVVTAGTEWYTSETHPRINWQIFALGNVGRRTNGSAEMTITVSGVLDWGNFYAGNQFYDPRGDRRVLWGWSADELSNSSAKAQGFQGALGLPREIVGPEVWTPNTDGLTYTITTVAQRPLPDVVQSLQGDLEEIGTLNVSATSMAVLPSNNSNHYHMQARIKELPPNSTLSIIFRASPDLEHTKLIYQPHNSSILLVRENSSLISDASNLPFTGSFAPYTTLDRERNSSLLEPIVFDLFLDGSMLEFFVNDRFALTQRVYPSRADTTALRFKIDSVNGSDASYTIDTKAVLKDVKIWRSMRNVWPNRPLNASSPLTYDGYEKTHVTFPNPFVEEDLHIYQGY